MYTSQSRSPKTGKPRRTKVFTDYSVNLAFERIEFYLRVLEAHFERLGAPRRPREEDLPREVERAAARGQ